MGHVGRGRRLAAAGPLMARKTSAARSRADRSRHHRRTGRGGLLGGGAALARGDRRLDRPDRERHEDEQVDGVDDDHDDEVTSNNFAAK